MELIDARGLVCPLPVVNTKSKLATMNENETVKVLVDNQIAVENLRKFAKVNNYGEADNKIDDDNYEVYITKATVCQIISEPQELVVAPKDNTVVVFSSRYMGTGDEKLGGNLMKAFIFALSKADKLPSKLLFYNTGAYLTIEGSESLDDIRELEANGVVVETCGTCLNFYGLTDKLACGSVTNMYAIVESQLNATKVIKP